MYLTHAALSEIPHIRHGFFTRQGGASTGLYESLNAGLGSKDDRAAVLENRARMAEAVGAAAENLVVAYQVHSAEAMAVVSPWAHGDGPQLDGLVTAHPDLALGTSHADCAPILFADRDKLIIGACHAGWRGAFGGVSDATIVEMERLGAARERIVAVIGPTISQAAYEVGPEFIAQFLDQDGRNIRFFKAGNRAGYHFFDLPGYLLMRLQTAGIGLAVNSGWCTYSDEARFYSYRRMTHRGEADYGRHLAVIKLAG